MSLDLLVLAFALVLIIEGLGPAVVPNKWRNYLYELSQLPESQLRTVGIVLIIIGWLLFMYFKP